MSRYYDVCIIGGGVLGSSVARNCAKKFKNLRIGLLDSEPALFTQNSSKNSGVLHTGIYYKPGTLKAKLSVEGVKAMKAYCQENDIEVNECGKLIVPTKRSDNFLIEKLLEKGTKNGTNCELVDANRAKEIEPMVKITNEFEHALYCPDAAVTNLTEITKALRRELLDYDNLEINENTRYIRKSSQYIDSDELITNQGKIEAKIIINCAGHDALRIAQEYGIGENLVQMALKGYYLKASVDELEKNDFKVPKVLLYHAPPAEGNMFLGVHTTPSPDGYFKIGPSALPAFSGRHFNTFGRFNLKDLYNLGKIGGRFLFHEDFGLYRKLLGEQIRLMKKINNVSRLGEFSEIQQSKRFANQFEWLTGGIRNVVFDENLKPLDDFMVKERDRSIHVINYNSPGWTSAFPMADYLMEKINL